MPLSGQLSNDCGLVSQTGKLFGFVRRMSNAAALRRGSSLALLREARKVVGGQRGALFPRGLQLNCPSDVSQAERVLCQNEPVQRMSYAVALRHGRCVKSCIKQLRLGDPATSGSQDIPVQSCLRIVSQVG